MLDSKYLVLGCHRIYSKKKGFPGIKVDDQISNYRFTMACIAWTPQTHLSLKDISSSYTLHV